MKINTILVGITISLLLALPAAASDYTLDVFGNANEDDRINMQDVTYTERIILEYSDRTQLSDGKYDGKINMQDVTQIELIILGREKELTLIDMADRTVTVPRPIERVIAISPNTVRTIIALGACDKLVATSQEAKWCTCYGMAVKAPPHTGGLGKTRTTMCAKKVCGESLFELPEVGDWRNINAELVVPLKSDLIFDGASTADATQEKTGTPTVVIMSSGHDLDTMYKEFETMGVVLEKEQEAEELISFVKEKVAKLGEVTSEIPESDKPRVYLATRTTTGARLGEVTKTTGRYYPIDMAGGINVAKGISGSTVLKEQIIAWNPDIILVVGYADAAGNPVGDPVELVLSDPDLQTVNAVKNERIYYTSYAYCYGTPQDKNLAAAFYLAKLFHPDKFDDLDVEEEGNEVFEAFLGVDGLFSEYADYEGWLREFLDK